MSCARPAPAGRASLDRTLQALAEPKRREVVDLLSQGPMKAGDLAAAAGLAPPAMSRHLRTLREIGLVEERHDGFDARVRVYQLRFEPMSELARWLAETEALWAAQLSAFKAHIESLDRESSS